MYTVDRRCAAILSPSESRGSPSVGAAICTPMRQLPLASFSTENASSISVVVASSMLKAFTLGQRQFVPRAQFDRREAGALGEMLEQESLQMVIVRGRQRAAAMQQMRGGQMRRGAGGFQRLDFDRVAIRFVEQIWEMFGEFGGQFEACELFGVARLQRQLLALLLGPGQRGLEHIGRRGAIAAFALLVEIDRRAMQAYQDRGGFQRARRMAEILGGDLLGTELIRRAAFPQEIPPRWFQTALRPAP